MGWLSKAFKKIWKPAVGAALGYGLGGGIGAFMGASQGLQMQVSEDAADKAAKKAEENAIRQEQLAAAAPTVIQAPSATVENADASLESAAGERKRRYSTSKTINSSAALRRYSSNLGYRTTVG